MPKRVSVSDGTKNETCEPAEHGAGFGKKCYYHTDAPLQTLLDIALTSDDCEPCLCTQLHYQLRYLVVQKYCPVLVVRFIKYTGICDLLSPWMLLGLGWKMLTLQRGVTGTARMLHALTHSSISRQVREQM